MASQIAKRCTVCARFRPYHEDDRYCIMCGSDALEAQCACGREFDYALAESGPIHCPRCGKLLNGKASDFED